MPQHAIACNGLLPRDCYLRLGNHEVAESIRQLKPSERPLLSRQFLQRSLILPAGKVVERGVRPLDGYRGGDDPGVHDVRYLSPR